MKKRFICLICVLFLISCAPSKDYSTKRNLMLLENYELPRNKPLKHSKKPIKKKLHKSNEKYLRKLKK
jgi:hypothetical protein